MRFLIAVLVALAAAPASSTELEQFDFCLSERQAVSVAKLYAEQGELAAFESVTFRGVLVDCRREQIQKGKIKPVGRKRIATFPARGGGVVHVDQVIVADPWFQPHQAVYRISYEPATSV